MRKTFIVYFFISILNLCLFWGLFSLFQNSKTYHQTLGKISHNYERTGDWNHFKIIQVNKPYVEVTNSNLLWWDAPIYECISERLYTQEEACYGKVRAAFFPLFPLIWKATGSSVINISMINYFFFTLGLALLFIYLFKGNQYELFTNYSLFLSLPTTVIFLIPYSEATFLFCIAIAVIGFLKDKYGVYFIGALLTAMVRPATVFVLISIIVVECIIGLRHQKIKPFFKDTLLRSLPFVSGYSVVMIIQYLSSGSWSAFSDSHEYWSGGLRKIEWINDWSIEGFGMNLFAVIVISLPALVFSLYALFSIFARSSNLINSLRYNKINYLFLVSMLYLSGILIFTLLTSGGNIHSYFRFTIASPMFYIGVIILMKYIRKSRTRYHIIIFLSALFILILALYNIPYGGNRFTFSYSGMYLLMITSAYLLGRKYIPKMIDVPLVIVLIMINSIWTTYLFNCYLSNGWIFT